MTAPLTDQQLATALAEMTADRNRARFAWNNARDRAQTLAADVELLTAEATRLRAELEQARTATPLWVDRDDLTELAAILDAERYRLDKGDGTPVPQPRWAANVRISQAVHAALAAATNPGHQSYCVAATQGCCSCEEPASPVARLVPQAGCDTTT